MLVSKSALSVCCCLLLCAAASAQITITESDIPRTIGDSFQYKIGLATARPSTSARPAGRNVWTFDTAAFAGLVAGMELVDKATTPLGARFPDANITIEQVYGAVRVCGSTASWTRTRCSTSGWR